MDLARELADAGGELNLSTNAAEALLLWTWPHHVRELESLVESHVAPHPLATELSLRLLEGQRHQIATALVDRRQVAPSMPPAAGETHRRNPLANRQRFEELLDRHEGNVRAVADARAAHRTQVHRWMDRLGIDRKRR
jgi:transcriptional regulator with GAF, ATPase, and Fis domain